VCVWWCVVCAVVWCVCGVCVWCVWCVWRVWRVCGMCMACVACVCVLFFLCLCVHEGLYYWVGKGPITIDSLFILVTPNSRFLVIHTTLVPPHWTPT
jgi:hypothetical protein